MSGTGFPIDDDSKFGITALIRNFINTQINLWLIIFIIYFFFLVKLYEKVRLAVVGFVPSRGRIEKRIYGNIRFWSGCITFWVLPLLFVNHVKPMVLVAITDICSGSAFWNLDLY